VRPDAAQKQVQGVVMDLMVKSLVAAALVGVLLQLAQRWGGRAAGMLTGLPIVSGPAMLWLAHAHGVAYAQEVCTGAVAAAAVCAVFALSFAMAVQHLSRATTLAVAALGALLPLLVTAALDNELPIGLPLVFMLAIAITVACLCALTWALNQPLGRRADRASVALALSPSGPAPASGVWRTALLAGLVTLGTSALASKIGAYWSGMLSSMPWVCAAVAMHLHRQHAHQPGQVQVLNFLHGYVAGLIGRSFFVAVVSAATEPWGVLPALLLAAASAVAAATCTGWAWRVQPGRPAPRPRDSGALASPPAANGPRVNRTSTSA
jgi:hypothetical protein